MPAAGSRSKRCDPIDLLRAGVACDLERGRVAQGGGLSETQVAEPTIDRVRRHYPLVNLEHDGVDALEKRVVLGQKVGFRALDVDFQQMTALGAEPRAPQRLHIDL